MSRPKTDQRILWLEQQLRKRHEREGTSRVADDKQDQSSAAIAADDEGQSSTTIAADDEHQAEAP